MTSKKRNIINWILSGLIAFIFVGSAIYVAVADAKGEIRILASFSETGPQR